MDLKNKTAAWFFRLVILGFIVFLAEHVIAADEPPTELYVRTVPEGAKVFLDGKEVGVTPGLFKVEPGAAKISMKLEGHDPIDREVDIHASRITRLELELKKQSPKSDDDRNKQTAVKKIHLPDADTKNADVVLDLASGELLKPPAEIKNNKEIMAHFTSMGKGDLFFDGFLGCLRGGKAMQWDGNRFAPFPEKGQRHDATAYQLPKTPFRVLITTVEKKYFDVTIISIDKDGGIDLEYRPADPAIIPDSLKAEKAMVEEVKKVRLYPINMDPAQAVFDLASGEIIKSPNEKNEGAFFNSFNRLGKGDLFLFGNSKRISQFGCLRGAKAMQWNGDRFIELKGGDQIAEAASYRLPDPTTFNLPKFPIRMLILTAEKKYYDVTINSATVEQGIDLQYRPADPALVPKNVPETQLKEAEINYKQGVESLQNGRTAEAIQKFQAALRLKPDYAEALNGLGLALAKSDRLQEAIELYRQALRLKPDCAEVHYNLGAVLEKLGRMQEATEHYRRAIKLKPDYVEAYKNLAEALEKANRPEEAAAIAQRAAAFDLAAKDKTVRDSQYAEKILRDYAQAIWKELPPKLDAADLSDEETTRLIMQTALEIADHDILPRKDIVDRYLLEKVQLGPPMDPAIWNSASVVEIPQSIKASPGWKEGFWNPIMLFYSCRNIALGEKLGNEKAVKYFILESYAPVPVLLVNSSLDNPEFITIYPNFQMICRLQRDQKGLYHISEIRQIAQSGSMREKDLPDKLSPARKTLWEYFCKVWDALSPKLDSLSTDEIREPAARIAASELAGKSDVFKEDAAQILAKLPKAEPFDRSQWQSKLDDKTKQENLEKARNEIKIIGMFPARWNPVQLTSQIRTNLLYSSKANEFKTIRKLATVSTIAAISLDQALDADPEHPVIATGMGDEMTIVHLRRNADGQYDLEDFEWLTKKK
jgi:Flp pilus assembly protein TadD